MAVRRIVVDHVLFVLRDLDISRRFYERALQPLGFSILYEQAACVAFGAEGVDDFAICQGKQDEATTTAAHVAIIAENQGSGR